jgi:hypothetical protein
MTILVAPSKLHWNYFLALERDMEVVARFIEFRAENFGVFSIELAHLLFAAASEVDVVAKLLCKQVAPERSCRNINEYRRVLLAHMPELPHEKVFIPRYGLDFEPWSSWEDAKNPVWWGAYNNVKHKRDAHFHEATLQNSLNALGALLLLTVRYYSIALAVPAQGALLLKDTTMQLLPESSLLRLDASHYRGAFVLRST